MFALIPVPIRLFACVALLGAAAPAPLQESVQGEWKNTKNTIHMRVQPCGAGMCGTVIWAGDQQRADAKKGSGKELIGSMLLRNLVRGEDGKWRGKVYVPDIDSNVSATVIQLDRNTIRITGCTLVGLICRTQHWQRLK